MAGTSALSTLVHEFESDAKQRAAASRGIDVELLLSAIDEAEQLGDHIGLTVLRNRVKDNLERSPATRFRKLLTILLDEIRASELIATEKSRSKS